MRKDYSRRGKTNHQPTVIGRILLRIMGAIHACVGSAFFLAAVTLIIPDVGVAFGLPFLIVGGFFAVNGFLILIGKDGIFQQLGQRVQGTGKYRPTVERRQEAKKESEGHEAPIVIDPARNKARLEQLETMKNAGLITKEEYREKRKEINDSL